MTDGKRSSRVVSSMFYMNRAWELALQGWGKTSPNPMVGAVLVKSGKIIAEGYHHYCGGDHAEIDALKKAGTTAKGSTLYVTLEPCHHTGRTPPCTRALVQAGIRKVVVGAIDPNPLNNGKSIKFLRKQGITVEQGILAEELTAMNEAFNSWIRTRKPFVTAKMAQTLDGKIACLNGESQWITSSQTRLYAHRLRFGFDAIMVGINTVLQDNPRLKSVPAKRVLKIILDTHGKMPASARLLEGTRPEDVWVFTAKALNKNIKARGIQSPLYQGRVDLQWVLRFLGEHNITSVLMEGGSAMVGGALERGLVDKMMIYVAPKIMGEGIASIGGFQSQTLEGMVSLKKMSFYGVGKDILIQGYPQK